MDSFLKSYEFEKIKSIIQQNIEQFIISKIKKTELTEVFNEKLANENLIRKELQFVSFHSKFLTPDFIEAAKNNNSQKTSLNIRKNLLFSKVNNYLKKSKIEDFLTYISLSSMVNTINTEEELTEICEKYIM
jgi:hypothetical protein